MSRLCAKPTCTEDAVTWLDIARQDRRVVERDRPALSAMGLCAGHRERFVVPTGWVLESSGPTTTVGADTAASPTPTRTVSEAKTSGETTSRERPWFLAGTEDAPASTGPLLGAQASYDTDIDEHSLSAGSLLRRAFHGPDADDDLQRRDDAAMDAMADAEPGESNGREQPRSVRTLDEYGTAQLPFPPFDLTPHAAVS